jgi:hypothetical protein
MSKPVKFEWFCSISGQWQECPCHHATCPVKRSKFALDDFSADAIEHRFGCGSWTSADVRVCIAAIRTCEQLAGRDFITSEVTTLRRGKEVAENRQS